MKIEDVKVGMAVKVIVGMKVDVSLRYPVEVLLNGQYHYVPVGSDEIEPVEMGG